jgi:signal transduction histidine kinase
MKMNQAVSILVVDDEPDNFDVIEALLLEESYHLNYASSGTKALERLENIHPDLILLDVMMPQMSGIQACQQIKNNCKWQYIPVIVVTALTSKEDLKMCLAAGADDFISKPINKIELQWRIRSMLRLKWQFDELQELLRLREDMVNMIVHDLRNPLTNIVLCAEILKFPQLSLERRLSKIDQIILGSRQLQAMIDNLLFIAKHEYGNMRLQLTSVDLCQLCNSVLTDFELLAAQQNITLVGDLSASGIYVELDAALFRRVLDNLMSNAIKFSYRNSQITLKVYYPTPEKAIIQVIDTGSGIGEQLREVIFQKYEVGNLALGVNQIGLGLAFCKMVVDAHNGQITIDNNYPSGTIFSLEIAINPNPPKEELGRKIYISTISEELSYHRKAIQ